MPPRLSDRFARSPTALYVWAARSPAARSPARHGPRPAPPGWPRRMTKRGWNRSHCRRYKPPRAKRRVPCSMTSLVAVNVALLTGYVCWRFLKQAGLDKLVVIKEHTLRTARKSKRGGVARIKRSFLQPRGAWFDVMLAGVGIFLLVFFPCIGLPGIKAGSSVLGLPIKLTQSLASRPNYIDQAWYDSLLWLKNNSPEPFGYADSYYELYQTPAKNEKYAYPESAYSIMSWWDYGHWITRISHRIPLSNPFQAGVGAVAHFFITQNKDEASEMLDKLDSKYIIIDIYLPETTKKRSLIFYRDGDWRVLG